jgi:hypothetical protein
MSADPDDFEMIAAQYEAAMAKRDAETRRAERELVLTAFDGIAWQFGKAGRKRLEDFIKRIRKEGDK